MAPEPIIHNSPALESLKHQQLRSLCARHGLKSTGKRDHLIRRLKGLREGEHGQSNMLSSPSAALSLHPTSEVDEDEEGLDGSYDFIDETRTGSSGSSHVARVHVQAQTQQSGQGQDVFTASSMVSTSRASTDEFGALSADAQTITKSSSWKDKLASVFGGNNTVSSSSSSSSSVLLSCRSLSTSHSSNSLSSTRTLTALPTLPSDTSCNDLQSSSSTVVPLQRSHCTSKGSSTSIQSQSSAITSHNNSSTSISTQVPPPTPAWRIVDDSFAPGNQSALPDCSFVPRRSFEDSSIDLTNVPVWPPRPGIILISPRQSPSKLDISMSQIPNSAKQKRYLDDLEEDDDEEREGEEGLYANGYGRTIRLVTKPVTSPNASATPGRKIATLPKRLSLIAASPPRFDMEAPVLPSFAAVANQALQQTALDTKQEKQDERATTLPGTFSERWDAPTARLESPVDPAMHSEVGRPNTREKHSSPAETAFVFGSPRQQPLTNVSFLQRIDGFAISKQLEELQRRTGLSGDGVSLSLGPEGALRSAIAGPSNSSSLGQQKRHVGQIRFDDKHQQEFSKMDSIENHYAAKRKTSQPLSKRTRTEPTDDSQGSHQSTSLPLNQQGRYAPLVPPRPKAAKTPSQQEEDRRRIHDYQNAAALSRSARRAGASASPRKAVVNPSLRKLPPMTTATGSLGSGSSSSTAAASRLSKSTISSLKSFGSSSSLSSNVSSFKTGEAERISTTSESSSTPQAEFGNIRRAPSGHFANSSLTRPTVASLARQASRQDLASDSHGKTLSSQPSHGSLKQTLSPRAGAQLTANLLSPRQVSTFERKKVSSISAAQRSSPMKAGLDESIAHARRIRAKKAQTLGPVNSTSELGPAIHADSVPSGSIANRPAWR